MSPSKLSLGLIFFVTQTLSLFQHSYAQNSQQDYLNVHNAARAFVGVANITWDTTLANYAQNYANQRVGDCSLVNSNGPYGENIAKGVNVAFTGITAVNMWVAERPDYNHGSNTCNPGKVCGHYTQVVWSNSVKLGCFRVQCVNGWYYVVCSYDPKGNIAGQSPY